MVTDPFHFKSLVGIQTYIAKQMTLNYNVINFWDAIATILSTMYNNDHIFQINDSTPVILS